MSSYLHVGALNITTSPPSKPEEYSAILVSAFQRGKKTKLQGDWVGMIGSCHEELEKKTEPYIWGDFYKYIDLEVTRDWFNLRKGKKAVMADLAEIKIPEHLKPHFQFLSFVFFPTSHRLFFVTKDRKDNLTPLQAQKIVSAALDDLRLRTGGKTINVIPEQSQDSLESIFAMERLHSLTIEVIPPNAFSDAEKKLLSNMNAERITKQRVTVESDTPKGLDPNKETKIFAKLALSLGKVIGKGNNAGEKTRTVSTSDHPYIEQSPYVPYLEDRESRLYMIAQSMLGKILSRISP